MHRRLVRDPQTEQAGRCGRGLGTGACVSALLTFLGKYGLRLCLFPNIVTCVWSFRPYQMEAGGDEGLPWTCRIRGFQHARLSLQAAWTCLHLTIPSLSQQRGESHRQTCPFPLNEGRGGSGRSFLLWRSELARRPGLVYTRGVGSADVGGRRVITFQGFVSAPGETEVKIQLVPHADLGSKVQWERLAGKHRGRQDRAQGRASPWCCRAMGDRCAARISVAEMKSYYVYSEWCSWLLSVAEGESPGPRTCRPWVGHRAPAVPAVPPAACSYASALQKGGRPRESPVISTPRSREQPREWVWGQMSLHPKSSFGDSESRHWLPKARDVPEASEGPLPGWPKLDSRELGQHRAHRS